MKCYTCDKSLDAEDGCWVRRCKNENCEDYGIARYQCDLCYFQEQMK